MTDMREALRDSLLTFWAAGASATRQHKEAPPSAFENEAQRLIALMQPEIDRRVAEERANLESKFRCVVSHATGGGFQNIDVSLNEISVRISQFRTQLWEQAKQNGAKEERGKLLERLREPSEGMWDAGEQAWMCCDLNDPDTYPVRDCFRAMLAQFEKENSDG